MKTKYFAFIVAVSCAFYVIFFPLVNMDVSPDVFPGCGADRISVQVSWSVRGADTKFIRIYVKEVGKKEALWIEGKVEGTQKTDSWVGDGLTFILKDDRGKVLSRRTVETYRCPI
ncbi:hypothetical protein J2T41_004837 [Pseudomonas citronellolis]|uniref:hypothetical protein n=1 Tax=Pseudomonas citronellolis TaxID=53408 RepID=UPI00209C93F9|nr:hypothetical protein [Pseudomonas citronellolis]MCP1645195.1 hypothetical protein [Pseudomonas citronellolis]MCP1665166.1 hypothetical protein [Pseudomonas citronellolis]MCP1698599.1 hypothetical protein [Pseudomonas citronellolis]MCP1703680.1 hypothetical protein [Pseudomonas citronellolis]MCP1799818.1 hypothetical protein [Pseudomonas citronellolis]